MLLVYFMVSLLIESVSAMRKSLFSPLCWIQNLTDMLLWFTSIILASTFKILIYKLSRSSKEETGNN